MRRVWDAIRRPITSREQGAAMVVVLVLGTVMTLVVTVSVAVAVSGVTSAKSTQDWNGALSAAYAGVEEYKNRLANDSTYQKYGNPDSAYTTATDSSVALPPASTNVAFDTTTAGQWASVPGSDGTASFRYEVDNSQYSAKGILRVRSTGRVGEATRTVVADLKQDGFLDYLYFTDFEMQDPNQGDSTCNPTYAFLTPHSKACGEIQFGHADVLQGPIHSNDSILACGTTFTWPVSSSKPTSPFVQRASSCSLNPTAYTGANFSYHEKLEMPSTSTELWRETRTDLDDVPRPGCLYTGPTVVKLNSGGTMTVWSPFTKKTTTYGEPTAGGENVAAACGLANNKDTGLASVAGATIPVLSENLMYVQDVPSSDTDPNYWPPQPKMGPKTDPANFACTDADKGGWKIGTDPLLRFPRAGEGFVPNADPDHYQCRRGDVFVNGTLKGAMTIAAANYIYVTGDVLYATTGSNILGLIGDNAVWVWNPMATGSVGWSGTPTCSPIADATLNRTIQASILSLRHTFQVQSYDCGGYRGQLSVTGTIAQKYRGPVATGTGSPPSTGYKKLYKYDDRLRNTAPPKFISPTSTTYGITQIASVDSAYAADGTCLKSVSGACR